MTNSSVRNTPSLIKKRKNDIFLDYFLITSIIAITGFEYFYRNTTIIYMLFGVAFIMSFSKVYLKFNYRAVLVIFPFVLVYFIQGFVLGIGLEKSLFFGVRLFTYYMIMAIVGYDFQKVFIRVIVFFSVISLVFYSFSYIGFIHSFILNGLTGYFTPLNYSKNNADEYCRNIMIYNYNLNYFHLYSMFRNSGPFWEPGMFTVFINIALFLNLMRDPKVINKYNVILIIANITTFSTTGYITMFITISYYVLADVKVKGHYIKGAFLGVLLVLLGLYVSQLGFMRGKIEDDMFEKDDKAYTRFGAALIHFKQIYDNPWIGLGLKIQEVNILYTDSNSTANGLTNVVRTFGIPVSVIYYFILFTSARGMVRSVKKNATGQDVLIFYLILLLVAFSQDITTRHFYFMLLFGGVSLQKKEVPQVNIAQ